MNRTKVFLLVSILLTLVVGCSPNTRTLDPYSGDLTITEVTKKAEWSSRKGHQVVSMNGILYLIGGYSQDTPGKDNYMEDVWSSPDGGNWTRVTESASWRGRWGHSVTVMGSTLYLSGGFYQNEEDRSDRGYSSEVWKSQDGKNWELVTDNPGWVGRMGHSMFSSYNGDLYIVGGVRNSTDHLGDMWKSSDKGKTWIRIAQSDSLPFGRRSFFASHQKDNFLFLFGGAYPQPNNPPPGEKSQMSNLYRFDMDTESWITISAPNENITRKHHAIVEIGSDLWILQGHSQGSGYFYSKYAISIYRAPFSELTKNSTTTLAVPWVKDSPAPPVDARYSYATVKTEDGTLLMGGWGGQGLTRDIWRVDI